MSNDFMKELRAAIHRIEGKMQYVSKAIAEEVFIRIIGRTPIDFDRVHPDTVGYARANWVITQDQFNKGVVNELDEVDGKAPVLMPNGPTAQKVRAFMKNVDVRDEPRLYLTNNVDYIISLEFGKSKQANYGMRRITADEFPEIARQKINTIIGQGGF